MTWFYLKKTEQPTPKIATPLPLPFSPFGARVPPGSPRGGTLETGGGADGDGPRTPTSCSAVVSSTREKAEGEGKRRRKSQSYSPPSSWKAVKSSLALLSLRTPSELPNHLKISVS
uniref:Uncharacterized protein n=1 Tax=Oryza meridionalis TaxID=40149 RepID=A0A0E0CPG9_9ORYZ